MKVKFITCIYSNLYGTDLGGRIQRKDHYRYSLLSLLKMNQADFLCYTSEEEIKDLKSFFYEEHKISEQKLEFKIFDLRKTKFANLINKFKDIEKTKKSDRCIEIQYSKFHWWWNEDKSYDYYYWIDAGLSHTGLLPNKYLDKTVQGFRSYFESPLFNNDFLNKLINFTNDKFFIIGKENSKYYWEGPVNKKWYDDYNHDIHVIGGLFGGKKEMWDTVVELFEDYTQKILEDEKRLYHEEQIMSLIRSNHKKLFIKKDFDIWVNIDNGSIKDPKYYEDKKSFYQIIEEILYNNEE